LGASTGSEAGDTTTECRIPLPTGRPPVELLWAREWLEHLDRVLEHTRVPSAGEQETG
jgi:hypothetical protein